MAWNVAQVPLLQQQRQPQQQPQPRDDAAETSWADCAVENAVGDAAGANACLDGAVVVAAGGAREQPQQPLQLLLPRGLGSGRCCFHPHPSAGIHPRPHPIVEGSFVFPFVSDCKTRP